MGEKYLIANWKMRLPLASSAVLAKKFRNSQRLAAGHCRVVVCPDFLALPAVSQILKGSKILIGAQDCAPEARGALTGEVSALDLRQSGAKYVILGHSERRLLNSESSAMIKQKIKIALEAGLRPIVCLGESAAKKSAAAADKYLREEVGRLLKDCQIKNKERLLLAYEPVWAISTGQGAAALPAKEAARRQNLLKKEARRYLPYFPEVLYGGSVNAANAAAYLAEKDIDGLLVGAASLDLKSFSSLC